MRHAIRIGLGAISVAVLSIAACGKSDSGSSSPQPDAGQAGHAASSGTGTGIAGHAGSSTGGSGSAGLAGSAGSAQQSAGSGGVSAGGQNAAAGEGGNAGESGAAGSPPAPLGGPCMNDSDCATQQCVCAFDAGTCALHAIVGDYPDGYCSKICQDGDCPLGSHCAGGGAVDNTACFKDCTSPASCRTGYECCNASVIDAGAGAIAMICLPISTLSCPVR